MEIVHIQNSKEFPWDVFLLACAGIAVALGVYLVSFFGARPRWKRKAGSATAVATVPARVFSRREQLGGGYNTSISTYYFLTFEILANGSRLEFAVDGAVYSGLTDDETGYLTYQGGEYLDFARIHRPALPSSDEQWICGYCTNAVPAGQTKCPGCGAANRVDAPRDLT